MRRQTILQAVGPLLIVAAGVAAFTWLQTLGVRPATSPVADKPPPVRTRVLGPPGSSSKFASAAGLSPVVK